MLIKCLCTSLKVGGSKFFTVVFSDLKVIMRGFLLSSGLCSWKCCPSLCWSLLAGDSDSFKHSWETPMDHAGHTVKNSAWQGGGFWKEIDGGDFGRELAGRRILSTFTKCGPRPTATLAAAKRGGIFKGIYSKGYPTSFSSWAFLSKFWDCISWTREWIGGPPYFGL